MEHSLGCRVNTQVFHVEDSDTGMTSEKIRNLHKQSNRQGMAQVGAAHIPQKLVGEPFVDIFLVTKRLV